VAGEVSKQRVQRTDKSENNGLNCMFLLVIIVMGYSTKMRERELGFLSIRIYLKLFPQVAGKNVQLIAIFSDCSTRDFDSFGSELFFDGDV